MKELMSSFLNNSELTENMKIKLSHRLGITQGQVQYFFNEQRKKPRNKSIQAYSELLQGKYRLVTYHELLRGLENLRWSRRFLKPKWNERWLLT